MKNVRHDLLGLLKRGYCSPKIVAIAKKLREPPTTVHYNVKQMEREKVIRGYKAVFDYNLIDEGFCSYVLVNLAAEEYADPERLAKELSGFSQIESVDIITGEWEMLLKIRTRDVDEFYQFVKNVLSKKGIAKTTSLTSLKQLKTEFLEV